jgi:hypothetical protein
VKALSRLSKCNGLHLKGMFSEVLKVNLVGLLPASCSQLLAWHLYAWILGYIQRVYQIYLRVLKIIRNLY